MKPTDLLECLLDYAEQRHLIAALDRAYHRNLLLDAMGLAAPAGDAEARPEGPAQLTWLLSALSQAAVDGGRCDAGREARDRFETRLMGLLTPSPAQVRERFYMLKTTGGPQLAIDWFYDMQRACDYIRVAQIAKNRIFRTETDAGELIVTINLSKPEKDPRYIAAQKSAPQTGYPKCMLCIENPGYAGRPGFPARQNHRVLPLTLAGDAFYFQYSPYLYYDEHCIVFNERHVPMAVNRQAFARMVDFVDQFPHYFIGSNADLPIVGGSILSHDHFQGGRFVFPMELAAPRFALRAPNERIAAEVADWPMTCVRLMSSDAAALIDTAEEMLSAWRTYSDPACHILAQTDQPHNTVTPILRKTGDRYVLSLVLRNNRTDAEHPLGLFHPHADLHHIKKENIGLIEVMGLFILPGRLLTELDAVADYLTGQRPLSCAPEDGEPVAKHYAWVQALVARAGHALSADAAQALIRKGLGEKCARVLADAGVYKRDEAGRAGLLRFLATLGYEEARV